MMCCLLNFTVNCLARIYCHNNVSASVGNFLFLRANSFKRRYLSGDAVLKLPSFFPIAISPNSLPSGRDRVGVIFLLQDEYHSKRGVG